jgi:hypothetical protein
MHGIALVAETVTPVIDYERNSQSTIKSVVKNSHENHLLEQRMHMHIRQLGYSIFLEKQK